MAHGMGVVMKPMCFYWYRDMHHKNPNRWQKIHESIHYPAQKEKKIQQVEPVFPEHPSAIREDARERLNFTDFFLSKTWQK